MCFPCRVFLDRPMWSKTDVVSYRWQNPAEEAPVACNLCRRLREWLEDLSDRAWVGSVELTLRFEEHVYHSTYRPTPPTFQTICRIDLKTYIGGEEQSETAPEVF
jgi:hypothetical protein